MTEYTGRGDPRRTMELLWGGRTDAARGPKPGLSVARVLAAGVALADAEGLAALSMRKVADRLDTSPMSLYTYVPGKAELLELMVDAVVGELPTDYSTHHGWRAALEASARDGWTFYERHPWVLQISGARPPLGPHSLAVFEAQLTIVAGLGLTGTEMMRIVSVVAGFVRGAAKAVADARTAEQETGISDDEWWNARAPLLEELATVDWTERYPMISRLDAGHAFDQPVTADDPMPYTVRDEIETFEFGLARVLDGVSAFVESRSVRRGSADRTDSGSGAAGTSDRP